MSSVVESVEASFKELVSQKPYRSITVKEICEGAFISRRTFYSNFVDKRAVIAYLFRRDAVNPVRRALDLVGAGEADEIAPILISRFYQGVLDEREYYTNLVKPMAGIDSTFELVVARAMSKVLANMIAAGSPGIEEKALKFVVYYHSSAQAIVLERWICEGFTETPEELGEVQAKIVLPSLRPMTARERLL